MYHRFDESKYPSTNIQANQFIKQLDFLESEGFTVWPLDKIIRHLKTKTPIPDKIVGITIDDAYSSVYHVAFPILKKRKIPFTVFIATDPIDNSHSGYMSWDQISEMVDAGVTIGNHSRSHAHLIKKQNEENNSAWLARIKEDIRYAERRIFEELKINTTKLAYPYGEYNLDIASLVSDLNYVGFGQQSGAIGEQSDFRFIPRFPMSEFYANLSGFKEKVLSLPLPIASIKPLEVIANDLRPILTLKLDLKDILVHTFQCFVSGQGRADIIRENEDLFSIKAAKEFTTRRNRYNCTLLDASSGRYYWYSHLWILPSIPES